MTAYTALAQRRTVKIMQLLFRIQQCFILCNFVVGMLNATLDSV